LTTRVTAFALFLMMASPALAQHGGIGIPQPGDAALFVVAIVGLIVGRHASRHAPSNDDDAQV
jgi:hypothetical protein